MSLKPGTRLGSYEIAAHVGSGGMGDVYRGVDTRLGRQVAIKILPAGFIDDAVRMARFEREAKALAALNHPNIAQIYDVEQADGLHALIMEFIEGPTVAERLARGALPHDEAIRIARQIAEALEAAHQQGIVHRDIKPANIKLTRGGQVKVLDFGLAKTLAGAGAELSDLGTLETVTYSGVIIGTPAFMAPEQARGEVAGRAADIWAFGCVLFALLTGELPFRRATVSDTIAAVLHADPDWSILPADLPIAVRSTLRRCLEKDLRARFHDIADVRIVLEDAAREDSGVRGAMGSRWGERAIWAIGLLAVAAAAVLLSPQPPTPTSHARRYDIVTPPEAEVGGLALSPDGSRIAFTALTNGVPQLYIRSLETGSSEPVEGTDGAALPFWSPRGQSVAFFADSWLKRVDLDTRQILPIAPATLAPAGGSWNTEGTILFAPTIRGRLLRVHESGGQVTQVHPTGRSPRFLADGRRFLFLAANVIRLGSLDGGEEKVFPAINFALPGPPGYMTFLKQYGVGQLFIRPFDEARLEFTGPETPMPGLILRSTDGVTASATFAASGELAVREVWAQPRRIVEYDRAGNEIRRIGESGGLSPALSPKGDYLVVNRAENGNDVWLLELARGLPTPFTSGGQNQTAIWSPDGQNIVFASARRQGLVEMFIKPARGGNESPVIDPPIDDSPRVATDWARDLLLIRQSSPVTNYDIYVMRMNDSNRRLIPILHSEHSERDAQFSPDMKWIAYESNRSGPSEVYVQRFRGREQDAEPQFQISVGGGAQVRWNPANGNELFYVALDGRLMSVFVEFGPDDSVTPKTPTPLFRTRIGIVQQTAQKQQYAVARDGKRFFVSDVIADGTSRITVIRDFKPVPPAR